MARSEKTGSEPLGQLIRTRRQALGMRRRDLVEATGLSYPYVSQIETGYRLPSDRALRDLAAALQVDPMELASTFPQDRQPSVQRLSTPSARPEGWYSNPVFASDVRASGAPPSGPPSVREVVADAVDLLERLSPDDRLDALAAVQRELVDRIVNDRDVRRAR
jgi:transcriptional regulator with XRE-family HTH domain